MLRVESSRILPRTLSIEACVEPHSKIFSPRRIDWYTNSKIVVDLPLPGGPCKTVRSVDSSAIRTISFCVSVPDALPVSTAQLGSVFRALGELLFHSIVLSFSSPGANNLSNASL